MAGVDGFIVLIVDDKIPASPTVEAKIKFNIEIPEATQMSNGGPVVGIELLSHEDAIDYGPVADPFF